MATESHTVTLDDAIRDRVSLIALLLVCATYSLTFAWMWDRWTVADSYYSHGPLVPLVSLYLVWSQREKLRFIEVNGSSWGWILLGGGGLLQVLSAFGRIHFLSGYSLLLILAGLVLYLWGWAALRQLWFPILFLFFMIPLPLVVIDELNFKLKMQASQWAVSIVDRTFHLPLVWKGSKVFFTNSGVLVVDDVCSGLRSLVSLIAFGTLYAYICPLRPLKRVVVFLASAPLAIASNVVRISVLCLVAHYWGTDVAGGWVHDISGWAIFIVALLLLFALEAVLRLLPPREESTEDSGQGGLACAR